MRKRERERERIERGDYVRGNKLEKSVSEMRRRKKEVKRKSRAYRSEEVRQKSKKRRAQIEIRERMKQNER